MAANRKLTPILTGRVVRSLTQGENLLNILFTDGSIMKIKTSGSPASLDWQNRKVLKIRQAGTVLNLDFEDESTAEIPLAEATSSVILRDGKGVMEYAD